jgi:hypothetical protein
MLLLDGVYAGGHAAQDKPRFQRVKAPDRAELEQLVYAISERTGRYLERQGLLVRDLDNSYLALGPADDTGLEGVLGSSITYRIAVGPHEGRKAFCLQSLPPAGSLEESTVRVAKVAGFSLHAGVAAARHERQKLERLCRYDVQGSTSVARGRKPGATITRPAIAEPRLSLTPSGNVRYQLKTPYRDGTTHVMLLRASCPPPFGPAFGCSTSLPAILSSRWILCTGCTVCRECRDAQERPWRGWRRWCRGRG